MNYTLLIFEAEPDEGVYWAKVAELPGCVTQGETLDEVVANAREAVELRIEVTRNEGRPVPEPSAHLFVPDSDEDGTVFAVAGVPVSVAA